MATAASGYTYPGLAAAGPADDGGVRRRLPSHDHVNYVRDLLLLVLLIVAFPWLVKHLFTEPAKVLRGAGVKAGL